MNDPAFRVLLRAGVRGAARRVRPCVARFPPGSCLLRVLPPPAVEPISRSLRSWPLPRTRSSSCTRRVSSVSPAGGPTNLSRDSPTRSRFPACSPPAEAGCGEASVSMRAIHFDRRLLPARSLSRSVPSYVRV